MLKTIRLLLNTFSDVRLNTMRQISNFVASVVHDRIFIIVLTYHTILLANKSRLSDGFNSETAFPSIFSKIAKKYCQTV